MSITKMYPNAKIVTEVSNSYMYRVKLFQIALTNVLVQSLYWTSMYISKLPTKAKENDLFYVRPPDKPQSQMTPHGILPPPWYSATRIYLYNNTRVGQNLDRTRTTTYVFMYNEPPFINSMVWTRPLGFRLPL